MNERFLHGGNIYAVNPAGKEWLDFSANINPLGLSEKVRRTIEETIPQIIHYPDSSGQELKQAIADYYGLPQEEIVLGNGAAELFYVFFHAVRPARVLLPIPSFSEYERAALSAGVKIDYYPLSADNSFAVTIDSLLEALPGHDCVILGNPNNPTGQLLTVQDMTRLVKGAKKISTMVIVDESFLDFCRDEKTYTMQPFVSQMDNLMVVRSLTKFYAIPGLRLGFATATSSMARRLEENKDPWNVNLLAQKAGVAALQDYEYQQASKEFIAREKNELADSLAALPGIAVFLPSVNFILLRLDESLSTSGQVCEKMRQRGILLRDCANYPGLDGHYLRVAVRSPEDNRKMVVSLGECIAI